MLTLKDGEAFFKGVSFEDVLQIYNFDRTLRLLETLYQQ